MAFSSLSKQSSTEYKCYQNHRQPEIIDKNFTTKKLILPILRNSDLKTGHSTSHQSCSTNQDNNAALAKQKTKSKSSQIF